MQSDLLCRLRERRDRTRLQWEALLRAEPVVTPLGHPDALVHLIDWSMDEIFSRLANPFPPETDEDEGPTPLVCPCGRNPLMAYFEAGRQALLEALVLAQAGSPSLDTNERDSSMEELIGVVRLLTRRETEAFCGVCQFRQAALAEAEADHHGLSAPHRGENTFPHGARSLTWCLGA